MSEKLPGGDEQANLHAVLNCMNCILSHTFDGEPAEVFAAQIARCKGQGAAEFAKQIIKQLEQSRIVSRNNRPEFGGKFKTSYSLNQAYAALFNLQKSVDCAVGPVELYTGKRPSTNQEKILACIACQFAQSNNTEPTCIISQIGECTKIKPATIEKYVTFLEEHRLFEPDPHAPGRYTASDIAMQEVLMPKEVADCKLVLAAKERARKLKARRAAPQVIARAFDHYPREERLRRVRHAQLLLKSGVLEISDIEKDLQTEVAKVAARIARQNDLYDRETGGYVRMHRILLSNFRAPQLMGIAYHLKLVPLLYGPAVTAKDVRAALRLGAHENMHDYVHRTCMPKVQALLRSMSK